MRGLHKTELGKTWVNTLGYSFSHFRNYINPSPVIKIEKTLSRVYTKACSHIFIIWQCGTESNEAHILLSQFHITDSPSNQRLQHWPTVIVKQVDFILKTQEKKEKEKRKPVCVPSQ